MKSFQVIKKVKFLILLAVIIFAFFYKSALFGQIPFPGDSLVANYEPYRSSSFLGFVPGSVPNKAQGPDVIKELVPWKYFTIQSLKKLEIPFWDPYNFSGNPLMANFQSGIFSPFNLIFFIFNFAQSWSIYIFAIPLLASIFTYLFLRRLKVSPIPSVFGGISYAFSLYMVVWMEYGNIGHTLLWLPLVLYFTDKLIEKINYKTFLGIVLVSLISLLSGYIQGFFYIYAVSSIYFFGKMFLEKKISLDKIFYFILALIFPVILSLFQLLPTMELFSHSTRGNYTLSQIQSMLNPIWYLVTVAAPDFFGNPATRNYWFSGTYIERVSYFGLIPFIFAVFAIISYFRKTEVKIFSLIFLAVLLISTDLFITKLFYLIPIPMISTTVPTRILSIFAFSGSILASFGLDRMLSLKNKKTFIFEILLVFFLLLFLYVFLFFFTKNNSSDLALKFAVSKRNLLIPIGTLFIFTITFFYYISPFNLFNKYKQNILLGVILVLTSFELFYYFQKITPFSPALFLYPQTPVVSYLSKNAGINRFWGYGSGYIESNFQTFDSTFSTEGNDPLHIREYTELLASSKTGRLPQILPRPDANIAPGFGKESLKENLFRQKVLNIVGVKYILNRDGAVSGNFNPDTITFPDDKYKLAWQNGFWQAYENKNSLSRIFLTNRFTIAKNNNQALKILFSENFDETKEILLLENPGIPQNKDIRGDARLISYTPNKIVVETSSNGSVLLFLSDTFYPGWEAFVDDLPVKILRADYAFRAITISSGKHQIVFDYKPRSFYSGLYASIISVFPLIIVLLWIKKRYEK